MGFVCKQECTFHFFLFLFIIFHRNYDMIYLKMIRHWTVWPKADDWSAVSRSLLGLKKLNRLHLTFDRFKTLASFPFQKRQSASLTAPHPLPRILTFFSLVLCLRKLKGVRRNGSRSTTPSYPPYRHTIRYPLVRGRSVRDSGVLGIQYSDLASTTAVITSQKKRKKKKLPVQGIQQEKEAELCGVVML